MKNIYCDEILLNKKNKLNLRIFFNEIEENHKIKKYAESIELIQNEELVTEEYTELIQFREELNLFTKGDKQNKFFEIVDRKLENVNVKSLCYTNKDNKKYHYSQAETKTIHNVINITLSNYYLYNLIRQDMTVNLNLHLQNMLK